MKKILLLMLLLVCLPSFAANWVQYSEKGWYDISSWQQKGYIVSAWFKDLNDGSMKPVDNKKVWYNISYIQANCSERKINVKSAATYGLDGELLYSGSWNYPDWHDVIPDSNGELKYYVLCSFK
jgi:hypothetical protein